MKRYEKSRVAVRPQKIKPMSLTERDVAILSSIHHYGGVLAEPHVQRLFFHPVTGRHQTRTRMSLLWQNGYVNKLARHERARFQDTLYWLDRRGAEEVAGLLDEPLSKFSYLKMPRLGQVEHDLQLVDLRLGIEESVRDHTHLRLVRWISEREFHQQPDTVQFQTTHRKIVKRNIIPDGLIVVDNHQASTRHTFLIELDRGREDLPRFINEKLLAGQAYVQSLEFQQRFRTKRGWWLIITSSEQRASKIYAAIEKHVLEQHRPMFWITTLERLAADVLTSPIWVRAGYSNWRALFPLNFSE